MKIKRTKARVILLTLAQEHNAVVAAPRSAVGGSQLGSLVALVAQTTVLAAS